VEISVEINHLGASLRFAIVSDSFQRSKPTQERAQFPTAGSPGESLQPS